MTEADPHRVVALALPGVVAADLSTASQVFGFRDEAELYSFTVCALAPGPVQTSTGFALTVADGLEALEAADTVVVPGFHPPADPDPAVGDALRAAHRRGARIVSVCVGAFALAAAGLLDGQRATTHWREVEEFRRRYPAVRLVPDVLFVDSGRVLTGAGQSASIDFYLHLVRHDFGATAADEIGRRMVVSAYRPGEQAQDAGAPAPARSSSVDPLARTLEWAVREVHRPLSLKQLAAHAGMPPRTFTRRFHERTRMAPMRWLSLQRVLAAQRLLETTDLPVDLVADQCGLGSAASLRFHMARELGTTPTEYRRTHRREASRS